MTTDNFTEAAEHEADLVTEGGDNAANGGFVAGALWARTHLAAQGTLTAREHLDAAWDAAHVPADGMVPAETEYMARFSSGTYGIRKSGPEPIRAESAYTRRLLDPPIPSRPEGAEDIQEFIEAVTRQSQGLSPAEMADELAASGVRVTGKDN